jgi:hypothetical protein
MSERQPLLLNEGERRADLALREALERRELHLDRKVRVASALKINHSGISDAEFRYALRAEFDFVVSKGPSRLPEFVVEFDGSRHLTDPKTIARDRMKEAICRRFDLPLLRIGVEALGRAREQTILAWLIDVYYLAENFYAQQKRGVIAEDEPFMYFSLFDLAPGGGLGRSMALDHEARLAMLEAAKDGLAPSHVPEQVTTRTWGVEIRPELVKSYAIFELNDRQFILGHAAVRNFDRFGEVSAADLASDLALADAGKKLAFFRCNRLRPLEDAGLAKLRGRTRGWIREGNLCDDTPYKMSLTPNGMVVE